MLLSTLPDLSGRTYDVIGVVFGWPSDATKAGVTFFNNKYYDSKTREMFSAMIGMATQMGADAIVDVKITNSSWPPFVIGTAVKLR